MSLGACIYGGIGTLTNKVDAGDAGRWIAYDWNSSDLLVKVTDNVASKTVEYVYDAAGRRVAKRLDAGDWRWYFHDGLNAIAEGTGVSDRVYATMAGGGPRGIISRDDGTNQYFYHFGRLGNVVSITDSGGDVVSLYTMDAFGNIQQIGDRDYGTESATAVQPYHFAAREYDKDTGLYCFNKRWNDAITRRYLCPASPYPTVGNNPANRVDGDGDMRVDLEGEFDSDYDLGQVQAQKATNLCVHLPIDLNVGRFGRTCGYI